MAITKQESDAIADAISRAVLAERQKWQAAVGKVALDLDKEHRDIWNHGRKIGAAMDRIGKIEVQLAAHEKRIAQLAAAAIDPKGETSDSVAAQLAHLLAAEREGWTEILARLERDREYDEKRLLAKIAALEDRLAAALAARDGAAGEGHKEAAE